MVTGEGQVLTANLKKKQKLFTLLTSDLFLFLHVASSLQYFGKEDVETFLNGPEDEASHHGAQITDDVVDTLVSEAEDVQEGHDVAFALCQQLLQEGLLKEAPGETGEGPVDQRLQKQ